MPSLNSFRKLEKAGLNLRTADAERFNMNDTLATGHDLECLFEVLTNVTDRAGNHAIFTPVTIVANPDFQKIKESGYKEYHYEPFIETLQRNPECRRSFALWKDGIEKKFFLPQMHGREHLNVRAWMKALQAGDVQAHLAFKEEMWGFVPLNYPVTDYQAAFLVNETEELEYHKNIITEGLSLFKNLFGYHAEYFVPPNGPFNNSLNGTLAVNGIKYRSAAKVQFETVGNGKTKKVLHFLGQKDTNGIRYLTRNCFFEPSQAGRDWVDSCLNDIKIAFRWHKPAIISSHRVNYIGSLNPANRDKGLQQLILLLGSVLKYWPDVTFMSTSCLGKHLFEKSN